MFYTYLNVLFCIYSFANKIWLITYSKLKLRQVTCYQYKAMHCGDGKTENINALTVFLEDFEWKESIKILQSQYIGFENQQTELLYMGSA